MTTDKSQAHGQNFGGEKKPNAFDSKISASTSLPHISKPLLEGLDQAASSGTQSNIVKSNMASDYRLKQKYVPDLSGFISLCESNYAKLLKLLNLFDGHDEHLFGLSSSEGEFGWIRIKVTERCKYTTSLQLSQIFKHEVSSPWCSEPVMQVRLYHDATMAEVLSFQRHRRLKPSYVYPNSNMYQKDEKAQCNQFLAEWLGYCLQYGHVEELDLTALGLS